jgi:predicted small lipoprotein YifL
MKRFQWLAVTAGIAALAACKGGDDVNMTNIEVNAADENLALPPVDANVDVNVDANVDTNATDNTADNNTVNAY